MYEETIKLLGGKGIKLDEGLKKVELEKIKELYGIEFPHPLTQFFERVLPVSTGFYNWRDFSKSNVAFIKECIEYPFVNIYSMAKEVYWCDEWGKEPEKENERIKEIHRILEKAPKLIPIYSHRYMPLCKLNEYPIVSIHGVDLIYYGESLKDYVDVEFGNKKQAFIDYSIIEHIPFWSDLM